MILATTSQRSILEQMELVDSFNTSLYIPNITTLQALDICLANSSSFNSNNRAKLIQTLTNAGLTSKLSVGIKKLIYMVEMASQDEEKVEKMVHLISAEGTL